jgi:predicted transcriptional regulator of viral defense system
MIIQNLKSQIYNYIENTVKCSQPFSLTDLYSRFPNDKPGSIRQAVRRLCDEKKITRVINGVYILPNPERLLKNPYVKISSVIEHKYLLGKDNEVIGYRSGINFSNQIGLTTQTASVETIFSNAVSNKKRNVYLNNNGIIVNAPRVEVNSNNYKVLQVLDLLTSFDQYSEYDMVQAFPKISAYLSGVVLSEDDLDSIVSKYPLVAQVKFYKAGVANVITHK